MATNRKEWQFGNYKLELRQFGDLLEWSAYSPDRGNAEIHIQQAHRADDNKTHVYVNWSARGDRTPEEARDYANRIATAAATAEIIQTFIDEYTPEAPQED